MSTSTPVVPPQAAMSCMTAIDTNILIYSLDRHDPVKRAKARALLWQLRSQSDDVVVPWQVLGEFLRFLRSLQDQGRLARADLIRISAVMSACFP